MTPPSVEVVRLGEQVSEGLDVASRNSRTMLDGERSIEAREALGRLLAEIDALNAELARQQELWLVQSGLIRRQQAERDALRKALGCAVEELERRLPLGADPLTEAIIHDGRELLAAEAAYSHSQTDD